jgi:hypothetical protein
MKQGWLGRQLEKAHETIQSLPSWMRSNQGDRPMNIADLAVNDYFICYPSEDSTSYFVFKKFDKNSTEQLSGNLALGCNDANRILLFGINAVRVQDNLGVSIGDDESVIKVEL